MEQYLCPKCVYLNRHHVPERFEQVGKYRYIRIPEETYWDCDKTLRNIVTVRTKCKLFVPITQTNLEGGKLQMVKINEIPSEGERINLDDLPKQVELIATSEKIQAGQDGKAGGLIITYMLRDGRTFPQKYTKLSGLHLGNALKELKLSDTMDLQDNWYLYTLTPMRMGYPRMLPIKKVK